MCPVTVRGFVWYILVWRGYSGIVEHVAVAFNDYNCETRLELIGKPLFLVLNSVSCPAVNSRLPVRFQRTDRRPGDGDNDIVRGGRRRGRKTRRVVRSMRITVILPSWYKMARVLLRPCLWGRRRFPRGINILTNRRRLRTV